MSVLKGEIVRIAVVIECKEILFVIIDYSTELDRTISDFLIIF